MNLPSNCHCTADVLFKLPALYQFFRPDEEDEGAVGRAEHTVDLVDAVLYSAASLAVSVILRWIGTVRMLSMEKSPFVVLM